MSTEQDILDPHSQYFIVIRNLSFTLMKLEQCFRTDFKFCQRGGQTVDPYFVISMCIEAVGNPMMKNYMTLRCNWRHGAELLIPWHDLEKIIIIIIKF